MSRRAKTRPNKRRTPPKNYRGRLVKTLRRAAAGVAKPLRPVWHWAAAFIKAHAWRAWPVVLLLAIGLTVWHQTRYADHFRLTRIDVRTEEQVSREELLDFLHTRLGQNIFSVDLNDVAQRVVSHPWVEAATVRRELPDGMVVDIRERHAVALLHAGGLYLVDERGVVFKRQGSGDPIDLPVLTGFRGDSFAAGGSSASHQAARVAEAVQLLRLGGETGVFPDERVSEIGFDTVSGFSLTTAQTGMLVHFGYGDYERKLRHFSLVAEHLGEQMNQVRVVDLAVAGKVVVRGLRRGSGA